MTHQLRMRSDEALAEKMAQTTNHLAAAKAFCAEVKERIGEEVRLAKLNVAKIEQEAAANTREEQRHLFQVSEPLKMPRKGPRVGEEGPGQLQVLYPRSSKHLA